MDSKLLPGAGKVSFWSEEAPPFDPKDGINQWLPVSVQWFLSIMSIVCFFLWGFVGRSFPKVSAWVPIIYFIFGLPSFYGLVSHAHKTVLIVHVVVYVLAAVFAYFGALLPFVIGWFVLPLAMAHVFSAIKAGLVKYDMETNGFAGPAAYGMFNAIGFLLYKHLDLSDHMRWFITIFILSLMTGGIMIVKTLMGKTIDSYKLNMAQLVRYYAFCLALYTFQLYGVARITEQWIMADCLKALLSH